MIAATYAEGYRYGVCRETDADIDNALALIKNARKRDVRSEYLDGVLMGLTERLTA